MASNILDELLSQVTGSTGVEYKLDAYSSDTEPSRFQAVDGDTIQDTETGFKFRTKGYDTVETQMSDKVGKSGIQLSTDKRATELLQSKLNSGEISGEDIVNRSAGQGVDVYGRFLYDDKKLAEEMVGSGLATNTDKYDDKLNKLYRKAQQKEYELTGKTNEELAKLRRYDLDRQSTTYGVVDRAGNLVDAFQSRSIRTLASLGDTILDTLKVWGDGNSELLDDYTKSDNTDKIFGYDNRDSKFAMSEANHLLKVGDYTGALLEVGVVAPELITESAPEMLEMMIGVSGKAKVGAKLFEKAVGLAKGNAGLLTWNSHHTNELIDERIQNNGGQPVSALEMASVFTTSLALGSLDRFTFKSTFTGGKSSGFITEAMNSLRGGTQASMKRNAVVGLLSTVGQTTKAMLSEGGQEYIQEIGDALASTLGTTKGVDLRELHYTGLTAALAGAVSGGAINHIGQGYKGISSLYKTASTQAADAVYKNELKSSTDEEIVDSINEARTTVEGIDDTITKIASVENNMEVMSNRSVIDNENGTHTINMNEITDPDVHTLYDTAFTSNLSEYYETRPEEIQNRSETIKTDNNNETNQLVNSSFDTVVQANSMTLQEANTSLKVLDTRFSDNEEYQSKFKPKLQEFTKMKLEFSKLDPQEQANKIDALLKKQGELVASYEQMIQSESSLLSADTITNLELMTQQLTKGEITINSEIMIKTQQDIKAYNTALKKTLKKSKEQLNVKKKFVENELDTRDIITSVSGLKEKIAKLNDENLESDEDKAVLAIYESQLEYVTKYAVAHDITEDEAYETITKEKRINELLKEGVSLEEAIKIVEANKAEDIATKVKSSAMVSLERGTSIKTVNGELVTITRDMVQQELDYLLDIIDIGDEKALSKWVTSFKEGRNPVLSQLIGLAELTELKTFSNDDIVTALLSMLSPVNDSSFDFNDLVNESIESVKQQKLLESKFEDSILDNYDMDEVIDVEIAYTALIEANLICKK